MNDIVLKSLNTYFKTLSVLGYKSYDDVYKLLLLILIRDFISTDFYGYISKSDYESIIKSLYNFYGTSCLIPYPNYCKNSMNILYKGSISEIAYRIKAMLEKIDDNSLKINISNSKISTIEKQKVLKPNEIFMKIDDIII